MLALLVPHTGRLERAEARDSEGSATGTKPALADAGRQLGAQLAYRVARFRALGWQPGHQ